MMVSAKEALDKMNLPPGKRPKLIAVTVLTSLGEEDLEEVGVDLHQGPVLQQVLRLARLTKKSGLDGVVASGQEASTIRTNCGDDFYIVTPGIRMPEGSEDDQKRIVTPEMAIRAGANYLVIGRPITEAVAPLTNLVHFHELALSANSAGAI